MTDKPQSTSRFDMSGTGLKAMMSGFLAYLGNSLSRRADIMAKAGTTFGGDRKVYQVFGWNVAPDYDTYDHLYRRNGLAKRVVKAYPKATWRLGPELNDGDGSSETLFQKAWKELNQKRRIFHYLERADRLATLGRYAILFVGWNDGSDYERLVEPVGAVKGSTPQERLLYLRPYSERDTDVLTWEDDPQNERFGKPKIYQVQLQSPSLGPTIGINRTVQVHWTRIMHLAEDVLESDLEGDPCLEAGLNLILDLEKTLGAAAEAFFQQWPPGITMTSQKDNMGGSTINIEDFQEEGVGKKAIEDFIHGVKRWMVMNGIDINTIKPELGDPTKVVDPILDLLAGATGIPKRILIGSERGELASSQDETAWNERIAERRHDWAEPTVLRPFIEDLIAKGALPEPQGGEYEVEWPENASLSEDIRSQIAERKSNAISKYVSSPGANEVVPEDVFLSEVMGFSPEIVDRIQQSRQELWDKEAEEMLKSEEDEAWDELRRREILGENQPEQQPGGGDVPIQ